jgi:hypothetical protein
VERKDLSIAVDYWPVVPGERLELDVQRYYEVTQNVCYDGRGNWVCTREARHELPHVAMAGYTVVGVWDQQWYADRHSVDVLPLSSVTHHPYTRSRS